MAGYNIGTAWIQVAISGSNLTREVEGQLNRVNTSRAENSIISGLGGAFRKVGKIAAGALAVASTVGLATGFAGWRDTGGGGRHVAAGEWTRAAARASSGADRTRPAAERERG